MWGVALIFTSVVYLAPLVYITNKETIDELLGQAGQVVSDQTVQIRDLAGQHASTATSTIKGYAGDYTAKAQGMLGSSGAKGASSSPTAAKAEKPPAYQASDFPNAPRQTPEAPAKSEPLAA